MKRLDPTKLTLEQLFLIEEDLGVHLKKTVDEENKKQQEEEFLAYQDIPENDLNSRKHTIPMLKEVLKFYGRKTTGNKSAMVKEIKKCPLTDAKHSNKAFEIELFMKLAFLKPLKGQPLHFGTNNEENVLKSMQISLDQHREETDLLQPPSELGLCS